MRILRGICALAVLWMTVAEAADKDKVSEGSVLGKSPSENLLTESSNQVTSPARYEPKPAVESQIGKEIWFGQLCMHCHDDLPKNTTGLSRYKQLHSISSRDWIPGSLEHTLIVRYEKLADETLSETLRWIQAVNESRYRHHERYQSLPQSVEKKGVPEANKGPGAGASLGPRQPQ